MAQGKRGRPGKFHPACRRAFDREARRVGAQALWQRARSARSTRRELDPATRRTLVLLLLAGSQATGLPIPARAPRWVGVEQRRIAAEK